MIATFFPYEAARRAPPEPPLPPPMKTMSYGWIGAILDEWNALEIFAWWVRERKVGEKKKENLGESLKRGQLTLLTREEMESQVL